MATWQCVKGCGACCYLEPCDRPDLPEYMNSESLELYLSLVGKDGWCIHYDPEDRKCTIYEDRPWFCRVRLDTFEQMFGISAQEFDEFAIDCCHQHIGEMYGKKSEEMKHYNQTIDNYYVLAQQYNKQVFRVKKI